jgi:hypothetical protein
MSPMRRIPCSSLLGLALILAGTTARADLVLDVSLDTSRLAANYTGPFALDFELVGTNGNTVTVSKFSFGSGGAAGPGSAFLTGGAGGDLGSSVTLFDNNTGTFFSDFNQQFTPGATLSFTVDATLVPPPSGGAPDNFSMVIFQRYDPVNGYNPSNGTGGTPIPTTDPTGADTFFNFNVNGPGTTTVSSYPSSSGDISITVTQASVVPEPSTGLLTLVGILGLAGASCRSRRDVAKRDPCPTEG